MDYEKIWKDFKELMQRTNKMTEIVKTSGVLDIMAEIEKMNTEYEDLPFQEVDMQTTRNYQ